LKNKICKKPSNNSQKIQKENPQGKTQIGFSEFLAGFSGFLRIFFCGFLYTIFLVLRVFVDF
jgi:hypothetical protein